MPFKLFKVFICAGIGALLIIRIIFFLLNVDQGSTDGKDPFRVFLCATFAFVFLSQILLFWLQFSQNPHKKTQIGIGVINILLLVINLFFMITFALTIEPKFMANANLYDWLKIFFWSN